MNSSEYIEKERRDYALYVLHSRAIPSLADGLKASTRRVLWTGRDGKKWKTASLAGATMPIHPHGAPEGAINSLTAYYGNNIPLFTGIGSFGTMLVPNEYGAGRYTTVLVSPFTKDVVFSDIELVPMQDNYDGSLQEPVHFLPLVPVVLLNPQEGIAVGFASSILPRSLKDIVDSQLAYLSGKKLEDKPPYFSPTDSRATDRSIDKNGKTKWVFEGSYDILSATSIRITNLPYGLGYESFIDRLMNMVETDQIVDYEDKSKDHYDIIIKFKCGELDVKNEAKIKKFFGLYSSGTENLNVLDFNGDRVLGTNFVEVIQLFTDWRLGWYVNRYERLRNLLLFDIGRYKDILLAIAKNVGGKARDFESKAELVEFLTKIGINDTDYIASLPVYRFTQDEKAKIEKKLEEANIQLAEYNSIISSPEIQKSIYVSELKEVSKKYGKV